MITLDPIIYVIMFAVLAAQLVHKDSMMGKLLRHSSSVIEVLAAWLGMPREDRNKVGLILKKLNMKDC